MHESESKYLRTSVNQEVVKVGMVSNSSLSLIKMEQNTRILAMSDTDTSVAMEIIIGGFYEIHS